MNIILIHQNYPTKQVRLTNHFKNQIVFYPIHCYINSDPIDDIISTLNQSNLQAKEFFRNLFKANSIKN
jgi:hypothetical protein